MCREIESACTGSGKECVFIERGRVYREREREREREKEKEMESVCLERGKQYVLK